MAIPLQSLSGTEVLRRGCVNAQTSAATQLKFNNVVPTAPGNSTDGDVPANHIITVLSVLFCEQGNQSDELIHMYIEGLHGSGIYLLRNHSIGPYQTFIYADTFALMGGDSLRIQTQASANIDIWYNYIDQSWV